MEARSLDPELMRLRVCLECSYALGGLDAVERCPECGAMCDAETIALPMRSLDMRWAVIGVVVLLVIGATIAFWLIGWGTGWKPMPLLILAGATAAAGCGVFAMTRALSTGARSSTMVAFTGEGVRERMLGVWTSVMPYKDLARVEVLPVRGWRSRENRWRVRIDVSFATIPLAYVRGTVELTEAQGRALAEELGRRMGRG